ncbi:ATP-binding protein [Ekhidna sp.]|uniref:AlbA family DNA-binding domain-containing protein n=1 Tax=Ekhidna sp. TaxID=2608089 RepID=UPI0032EB2F74
MQEYLTEDMIKEAIKTRQDGTLIKRESYTLEFKETFDWTNRASRIKYLKSIAAFANNRGGLMVFGISDGPRKVVGIDNLFIDLDDSELGQFMGQYFSPTPEYERREVAIRNKKIGALYIHPAENKPVVCTKSYGDLIIEASIYYRYHSRSDKIKSGDLIYLIKQAKEDETRRWMELFSRVSTIGIQNAGIFNVQSGEIKTSAGNKFILDERLIKDLKVLDKYSLQEDGAEAVKIIGQIDEAGAVIHRSFAIHDDDILKAFLTGQVVDEPFEYLEAICYQSSGIFPARYFVNLLGVSIDDAIDRLKGVNTRTQAKSRLISLLSDEAYLEELKNNCRLDADTATGELRREYHDNMVNGNAIEIENEGQAKRVLEAVLNLERDNYDQQVVKETLLEIVERFYATTIRTQIRQAISYLDLLENGD